MESIKKEKLSIYFTKECNDHVKEIENNFNTKSCNVKCNCGESYGLKFLDDSKNYVLVIFCDNCFKDSSHFQKWR